MTESLRAVFRLSALHTALKWMQITPDRHGMNFGLTSCRYCKLKPQRGCSVCSTSTEMRSPQMLQTRKLTSAIAGFAMMALPVSAMAADHHHNWNHNFGNGQLTHYQNFARRPAAVRNQFVHNQALRDPIARGQARPGLDWGRGLAFGTHHNYAWNQSNRQNWAYPPHNNGNLMANNYREW